MTPTEANRAPAGTRPGGRLGRLARRAWFAAVTATTIGGTAAGARLLWPLDEPLRVALVVLFGLLFARIAVGFWTAIAGAAVLLTRRDPLTLSRRPAAADPAPEPLRLRTALVVPVHRESPARVAAGVRAMADSLRATGEAAAFEFFVLSDTPDELAAQRERRALAAAMADAPGAPAVHFRRRSGNAGRKPGNIAEFCRRWGGRYDCMVVLDADSLMAGETLVTLARAMQRDPSLGLIQTVPLPVRQQTRFGRLQQFAAALHAPLMAAGQAFWQGDAGNYWGHNAILRVRAFAGHCGLPRLAGDPPLGGDILSHDFVEAALLRRGGWRVVLDPWMGGSFEEMPGDLLGYGRRDRRWAQGNLQHLRLLRAPGLHPVSRLHFLLGAGAYVSGLLWLVLVALGLGVAASGAAPPIGLALGLVAATLMLVLGPRLVGLAHALARRRRRFGGGPRLAAAGVAEMLAAAVLAPVLMTWHAGYVLAILAGRGVGWVPQRREAGRVAWRDALRAGLPVAGVGLGLAVTALVCAPHLVPWLAPALPGMLLAPVLVRASGERAGQRTAALLAPPFERDPPAVLAALERAGSVSGAGGRHRGPAAPRERPLDMPAQPLGPATR
jgi:membrane glycosyltransferase